MANLLEIHNVRRSFPRSGGEELLVLDDVNLTLKEGEIVGLLGRSGSGKSTLLRLISGLSRPQGGTLSYMGSPIEGPVQGVAMVFQGFALFPWMTVLENVQLGLEALGLPQAEIRSRALAAIDLIGLDGYESAYPRELSGGMRQRVGFARAVVVHPNILLMDEPFSALDAMMRVELQDLLLKLWSDLKLTILFVTHDLDEALYLAQRVILFSASPGTIADDVTVPLAYPRRQIETRSDPTYLALRERLYRNMVAQVMAGRADVP